MALKQPPIGLPPVNIFNQTFTECILCESTNPGNGNGRLFNRQYHICETCFKKYYKRASNKNMNSIGPLIHIALKNKKRKDKYKK
ncbi:hypothetical protein QKU48_gp0032 [Fadolivirus algeromassiliense]|uniref:Uncharacterized protein n=1 Tax=Fadolivirus FV1/VV64 TaxID=3070911 RepID=A0A7D3USD8_9VIRU|nr:hypothetical protein QKU48_gp0032 [Fadolivirus algeromassiliense]QKF93490.1 hypothetical protein Fadolivirus_1_32 [Fadolivirus FV1/VV64]